MTASTRLPKILDDRFSGAIENAKQLLRQGHSAEALKCLQKLGGLALASDTVDYLIGCCHSAAHQHQLALECFMGIIERNPAMVPSYVQLAQALTALNRSPEALQFLGVALTLHKNSVELLHAQAQLLKKVGQKSAALQVYEKSSATGQAKTHHLLDHADLLHEMKRFEPAQAMYESVLKKEPQNIRALNNLGNLFSHTHRHQDALNSYGELLKVKPDDIKAVSNMATIYLRQRDFVQAHQFAKRAFQLDPGGPQVAGTYLYAMSFICDWTDYEAALKCLEEDPDFSRAKPLTASLFCDSAERLQGYAAKYSQQFKPSGILGPLSPYPPKTKIKLGYFSSDFYTHATVMLIRGLLADHDREKFEVHAFSLRKTPQDEGNQKIRALVDHYHDVQSLSDPAVALMARQLEIDIAIDLKGYTEGCRPQIFAERAAPVQINFLGFPGTMGAPFIDAMVADHYTVNADNQAFFSEKIIAMPGSYQPNDPGRPRPFFNSPRPTELPPKAFVYCCFNNMHKVTPRMFKVWMRILKQTPGSVLWMLKTNETAKTNFLKYTQAEGVNPARIIFAEFLPEKEHLDRLSHADLFLDTYPYNAHTTASDALWAGVPIVTKSGNSFASRVAGSLLSVAGMSKLITDNDLDYERQSINYFLYGNKKFNYSEKIYDSKSYTKFIEDKILKFINIT
jgi:predicted O-linked N-acetylglucosamine transferase (SPINDLY family)